jgi:hypothetical protein
LDRRLVAFVELLSGANGRARARERYLADHLVEELESLVAAAMAPLASEWRDPVVQPGVQSSALDELSMVSTPDARSERLLALRAVPVRDWQVRVIELASFLSALATYARALPLAENQSLEPDFIGVRDAFAAALREGAGETPPSAGP